MSVEAVPGRLFQYSPGLSAFEFGNLNSSKVLLFVGGLGDDLLTVPYVQLLSKEINKIGWSLIQIQISSSRIGWGTGSLQRDSEEIGKAVKFFKSSQAKK
ncbi:unnamed protein product [Ambrosiozyma monospora]|uniref:Unnamed protein product n=1 Tax=Ambrosiozyma monospora TaxID=43982 RepID=A0A9W6T399_AMBMO|nr:unnamed protein product [Ambrosiozyma monospora]